LVDEIRKTQRKTGVTAGTVRSATSSVSFVAGTITGFEKPKGAPPQPGGVSPIVPNVPLVQPKPGPIPGTALAGASSIGQILGVPPEVPPAQPLIPLGLLWRPDVKKSDQGEGIIWRRFGNNKFIGFKPDNPVKPSNPEWTWENSIWVYRMPADKDWTIIGREGDTLLTDLRDPPKISRHHAGIRP